MMSGNAERAGTATTRSSGQPRKAVEERNWRTEKAAGADTDRGALARGQPDERQQLLRWQAWWFSAHRTFAASAAGALVAVILRYLAGPFSFFIVFQVTAFYAGLVRYSSHGAS